MKRQKTVFGSIDQVCHVWAQQSQPTGKSGNVFFEGAKIHSYGYHYTAAMFHQIKGQTVVLINSNRYSNSTAKHLNSIVDAVRGQTVYHVPNVRDPYARENASYMVGKVTDYIQELFSRSKVTDAMSVVDAINRLKSVVGHVNDFLLLTQQQPVYLETELVEAIHTHLTNRYNRYVELNSPELLALRNDKASKRRLAKLEVAKVEREQREQLEKQHKLDFFIARNAFIQSGNELHFGALCSLERKVSHDLPDLFMIKNNVLTTTRGAEVPLSHAVRLFDKLKRGELKTGDKVGHFTVDAVSDNEVSIGCHTFNIEEVEQLFSGVQSNNGLKLVNQ